MLMLFLIILTEYFFSDILVRGIFVISGSEKKKRKKDKSQLPYALTVSQTTENRNKDCDKLKIINKIKSGSSQ